jgi:plastocyanin
MKSLTGFVRAGLCLALLSLSTVASAQTTHDVTVGDNFFSPSNITIAVGDTVRWTNPAGGPSHNVTGNGYQSVTASSFTFTHTFTQQGIENYQCTIHPGMQGSVTVQGGGGGGNPVDLSLSEISVNNNITYAPGDAVTIGVEVDNLGTGGSNAYSVDFYVSTDSTITSGDTLLGTSNRPALGAGNDDNFNANVNLPQNLAGGSYFVGGIIDISDANNGNNSNFENEPINVQAGPAPADLVLQSVNAADGPHEQGSILTIQSTVTNAGGQAAGAYSITFYASDNNIISETDTPIGTVNRGGLAAGANDTTPFEATIPPNLPIGEYFIGGIIDFVDSNGTNNVAVDGVVILVVDGSGTAFIINNGLNDAWYNEATTGQGFFITVFPDIGSIFLAWFTYDTTRPPVDVVAFLGESGHRWLTAFGTYAGNVAVLDVELTEGGVFNSEQPMVSQTAYGTIEIEFIDCNNAILRYDFPSLGLMGEIPITRIATDNVPRCQAAQPQ